MIELTKGRLMQCQHNGAKRARASKYPEGTEGRLHPQQSEDSYTIAAAALAEGKYAEDDAFFVNEEFVESCGLSIIHRGKDYSDGDSIQAADELDAAVREVKGGE